MQKQIAGELEWLRQAARGQQKKGRARMRRYEDLVDQALSCSTSCSSSRVSLEEPLNSTGAPVMHPHAALVAVLEVVHGTMLHSE